MSNSSHGTTNWSNKTGGTPAENNNQPPESTKLVQHLLVITCTQQIKAPFLVIALRRPLPRRPSNHAIVKIKSYNNKLVKQTRNIVNKQQSKTTTHNNQPPESTEPVPKTPLPPILPPPPLLLLPM